MFPRRKASGPAVTFTTTGYFDHYALEYSPRRLRRAVELINEQKPANATLIDVGCGVGNVLAYVAEQTGITRLTGIDVSSRGLALAAEKVDADLHQASVLDTTWVRRFRGQFDFAVMAAVLHHVIGPTRQRSRRAAAAAVSNAFTLVRPGGHLLIVEPTFVPSPPLTALFWTKRLTSTVVTRRLPVGGYWNNIGPPVVSYYSDRQVRDMVARQPGAELICFEAVPQRLSRLAGAFVAKSSTTVMAHSTPSQRPPPT
jgi:2-polyprenyl-3-methyl-5-hydroxy-6-metoxy-1,4-benzoquinol methylase